MTQESSIAAYEERSFATGRLGASPWQTVRRALEFALGFTLIGAGGWLLYRNLLYGDVVSVTIALLSAMMVGSGTLLFPTGIFGRRDW